MTTEPEDDGFITVAGCGTKGMNMADDVEVTSLEAIEFLEAACRNWSRMHPGESGIKDTRIELGRFRRASTEALRAENERLASAWRAKHAEQMKDRAEAKKWFEQAQTWRAELAEARAEIARLQEELEATREAAEDAGYFERCIKLSESRS